MKAKDIFPCIVLTIVSFTVYAESDDWRLMIYQFAEKTISESFSATVYFEEGFFKDAERKEYFMPDCGLKYYTNYKYFPSFSVHYRENYIKNGSHDWIKEIRPYIRFNLYLPDLLKASIYNNLRFEYRKFDAWENWRVRNITQVFLPLKLTPLKLIPYFGDEIRYSCESEKVSSNEFLLGVFYKLSDQMKMEFFCRTGHYRRGNGWNDMSIYGVGVSWKI